MKYLISFILFFSSFLTSAQNKTHNIKCATCLESKYNYSNKQQINSNQVNNSNEPVIIDYLFIFDQSGLRYAEEHGGGKDAFVTMALRTINDAMKNSDVNMRFRLVGTMILSNNMSSIDNGLDFVLNSEEVKKKRRELKADIVTICSEPFNNGISGVAMLGAKRDVAYSSVLASAVSGYVTAHEVAHIFGCQHARTNIGDSGTHEYAVGVTNRPYYSLMAYSSDADNVTTLAPIYSGVKSIWKGVQLGSPREDNVRMLRERMHEVSTFGDYLEKKYYVSQSDFKLSKEAQSFKLIVRTDVFASIESKNKWIKVNKNWTLDDVEITITVEGNQGEDNRTGSIKISGTDGYEVVFVNISQAGQKENTTSIDYQDINKDNKILFVNNHSQILINKNDIESIYIYDISGKVVYTAKNLKKGDILDLRLQKNIYIAKIYIYGKEIIEKISL